jgi:hypothetical protein
MRRLVLASLLTLAARAVWAGPDLRLDVDKLARDVAFDLQAFDAEACERREPDLCVGAPGVRKLVRFSVLAVNAGDADLVVGNPTQETDVLLPDDTHKWVFSACHNHFHFQTFARYELRRTGTATPILQGRKRSFCIEDTRPIASTSARKYCCSTDPAQCPGQIQGVQVGWGDDYPSTLPCQWIDITDLDETGTFDLCVLLNTEGFLLEDPAGNAACIPLTITPPTAAPPRVRVVAPGGRKVKAGGKLRVRWRQRVRGEFKFREVWLSTDGGTTWMLASVGTKPKPGKLVLSAPGTTTDDARVRVVVWTLDPGATGAGRFVRGVGESATFRIVPRGGP